MAKAVRFDRGSLRPPTYLADGSAIVEAVITRAGVFEYRRLDGSVQREFRDPKEVFSASSMRSFEHMAVTYQHPREGLVTIENRAELGKGTVLEGVRRDGNELVARLHITDLSLLETLKAGTNAVSCGYEQDYVAESGTSPDGERYDGRQTGIEGNHVAIVDVARAGDGARVRMDSATMIITLENHMFKTIEEATAAYNAEKLRADAASEQLKAASKTASEATARADAADEKATKAEKLRVDGEKMALENARDRVKLEATAEKVLRGDGEEKPSFAGKSNTEIKLSVIEKLTGKKLAEAKRADAVYVDARYDAAMENEASAEAAIDDVRGAAEESGKRNDSGSGQSDAAKARADMIERQNNAWKTPVTK